MTGKDLQEEDAAFMRYLADNGWEGDVGDDDDNTLVRSVGVDDKESMEASVARA
jgi:hypothetical protein